MDEHAIDALRIEPLAQLRADAAVQLVDEIRIRDRELRKNEPIVSFFSNQPTTSVSRFTSLNASEIARSIRGEGGSVFGAATPVSTSTSDW